MTLMANIDTTRPTTGAKKLKGPMPVIADRNSRTSPTATTAAKTTPPPLLTPEAITPTQPSPVQMALAASQADAQEALVKLRDLLVGPTQRLNEARLEELVKIFEERENVLLSALRDMQKQNAELEVAFKQNDLESANVIKTEMHAVTDALSNDMKKGFATLREELAALRSEAQALFATSREFAVERIATLEARTASQLEARHEKIRGEVAAASHTLEQKIRDESRRSQAIFSRVLKEASEGLSRLVTAKD